MKSHLGSIDADDRVGLFESGFVSRAELLQQVNLHWCALLVLVKIRGGGPQHPDIVLIFDLKNRLFRLKRQKKSKNLRLEKFIFEVPYSLLFETVKTFKTSPFDRCEERYSQR